MTSENHTVIASETATVERPLQLVIVDGSDTALPWRPARPADSNGGEGGGGESANERWRWRVGLTPAWRAGALGYQATQSTDAWSAVSSWQSALEWVIDVADRARRPIGSLQVWCHGGWGSVRLGETRLDCAALEREHALAPFVDGLRDRLAREALVWFRCCSAFGDHDGQKFAVAATERFRCRVAGHTHVIGFFQSGLHSLAPGEEPGWDPREGVRFRGGKPAGARSSWPHLPNTITCLHRALPSWARAGGPA